MADLKNCIACSEPIQLSAKLCKHCQTMQDDQRFLDTKKPPLSKSQTQDSTIQKIVESIEGPSAESYQRKNFGVPCSECRANDEIQGTGKCLSCLTKTKPQTESNPIVSDSGDVRTEPAAEGQTKSSFKFLWVALALIGIVIAVAVGNSQGNLGDGSLDTPSGAIEVEEFYCSFGTQTATVVLGSTLEKAVDAFVIVGLYGPDGTLQHSAQEWGLIEGGGSRMLNVSLSPYHYYDGECKVIDAGY